MSYNQNIDRMFIEYKVYRRVSDLKPFISRVELPSCQMIGKKKFVGKKAKMEAVYRLTGKRLPEDYTTEQVNNFSYGRAFLIRLYGISIERFTMKFPMKKKLLLRTIVINIH